MDKEKINVKGDNISTPDMLVASSSPHIRAKDSVDRIMLDVIIALTPAIIGSLVLFKTYAAKALLLSVISAVVSEAAIQKVFKRDITIRDLSAVVTGILLAFNLPADAPWYLPVFGSVFAIVVVKQLFGGLGQNFMNPALAGRAALMVSWPGAMTTFISPKDLDVITSATPLAIMDSKLPINEIRSALPSLKEMLVGNIGGTIGETSAILLIIGGLYLIYRRVIDWKIPIVYIATTGVVLLILGVDKSLIIYQLLSGGLILGAFFMATDYVSIPVTPKGRIVFALGAGFLTAIIRVFGGYPEGVSYSILLMNVATPIIEKFTAPKTFGRVD